MTKITAELTKPLLIDGAMSTALEQLGADTNNSLWTASVLANQPFPEFGWYRVLIVP